MEFTKKRYSQPIVKIRQHGESVLTASGEGDPLKDPSRVDIYANVFEEAEYVD